MECSQVGLRSLPGGSFDAMSARDMTELVKKIDSDGSGEISLPEIYDFIGRDYATYLEDRVRQLLLKAEEKGLSVEDAFREWDADGCGTLSLAELEEGLRKVSSNDVEHKDLVF